VYETLVPGQTALNIIRVPATGTLPPCLKVEHQTAVVGGMEKADIEFIRLSMPVKCNDKFVRNKLVWEFLNKINRARDRHTLHSNLARLHEEKFGLAAGRGGTPRAAGRLMTPSSTAPGSRHGSRRPTSKATTPWDDADGVDVEIDGLGVAR